MTEPGRDREQVEKLAEEFVRRYRAGERPSIYEYVAAHPEQAAEIRELFPTLVLMEELAPDDSASGAARAPPAAGNTDPLLRVGDYRILREVGRGGMGIVYEAEQESLGRRVALKVLPARSATDPRVVERFRRESRAAARLHHTNIVPIFEVGQEGDVCYFAMQLIQGQALDEVLKELQRLRVQRAPASGAGAAALSLWMGTFAVPDAALTPEPEASRPGSDTEPLPVAPAAPAALPGQSELSAVESNYRLYCRNVARIGLQAADALAHAHARGIIHRDVKPSNLLLDTAGVVWVGDFGLARTEDSGLTEPGEVVGTLRYMPPERFKGECDARSDVYSLGLTLYELLVMRPAFEGTDRLRLIEQISRQEPARLRKLDRRIASDLETVVLKAMDKEPQRRYQTAEELAADLRRFLGDEPLRARRTGPLERLGRWCRRNPSLAALLTSVAVLLLLLAGGASLAALWLSQERDAAVNQMTRAERELFKSTFAQARALRQSGAVGQRFESLKTVREAIRIARSLDLVDEHALQLRNEVIACLALADLEVAGEWDDPAPWNLPGPHPVAFDAALERYAWGDVQGNVHLTQRAGHQEILCLSGSGQRARDMVLRFSPDGRFLATESRFDGPVVRSAVWDLAQAPTARAMALPDEGVSCLEFSPDSRQLAATAPDTSLRLYDLAGGKHRVLSPGLHAVRLAFRPDGRQLALVGSAQTTEVQVVDVATGAVHRRLRHPDDVNALAWSADGRLLAVGDDDRNVHVWDTAEWRPQAVLEGHQKQVVEVAFSPAGDLLASGSLDGTTRLWDPVSGRQLVSAPGMCLHFGPDGRRLAFRQGGRLGLWEVADGRECAVLHHGRVGNRTPARTYKGPEGVDFSSDGSLLLSAAGDGVRLWDVATRREIAFLNTGHHEAVAFHPGGSRFYAAGRTGLRCWPIRSETRGTVAGLRVGPSQVLDVPAGQGWFRVCCSRDRRVLAASEHLDDDHDRTAVFPADRPAQRTLLQDCPKVSTLALSPDGRWVAAGMMVRELGVHIWDTRSGRLERRLPSDNICVAFSPDGQWLVAGGWSDYRLWKVDSWEPGPVIPRDRRELADGPLAFTGDSRLLAIARSLQQVKLLDVASCQEVATLAAPDLPCICWPCFSPDGSLLAVTTESHSVQLWDLGAIGRQLQVLGLGCDLLPALPPGESGGATPHVRVFQDVLEAEHLRVVASADCPYRIQDMKPWGREKWSNGKQLLGVASKGGSMELEADVPEAGRYALAVHFTTGLDYGLVAVALDDARVGDVFDGYHEGVAPSGKVELGVVELREGSHRLRFTAVGKDPESAGYGMGIDCVKLTPAPGSSGNGHPPATGNLDKTP